MYYLGIGQAIAKSTLSKANENRDCGIFSEMAMILIEKAKSLNLKDSDLDVDLKNNVFTIDVTVIDVCLSALRWAKFRTTKGGIKIHVQLDLKTAIPEFIQFTLASVHEVNIQENIVFLPDSFSVVDRSYTDFARLCDIHKAKAFFITRAKGNLTFLECRPYLQRSCRLE